jgi:hypothetical protein
MMMRKIILVLMAEFPEVESVKNDEKRHGDIVSGLLH